MINTVKLYHAIICVRDSDSLGRRVQVFAASLGEARKLLEAEYGKGNVFSVYNEEDAARPR